MTAGDRASGLSGPGQPHRTRAPYECDHDRQRRGLLSQQTGRSRCPRVGRASYSPAEGRRRPPAWRLGASSGRRLRASGTAPIGGSKRRRTPGHRPTSGFAIPSIASPLAQPTPASAALGTGVAGSCGPDTHRLKAPWSWVRPSRPRGAAEGWDMGRRQVTCSAVSGKSLARAPAWSSLARTPAPSSRQLLTHATGHLRCTAALLGRLRVESRARSWPSSVMAASEWDRC
jgi:hypothetical protein